MDSLRYWVIECHVDGFRFDLASALARELYDVDRLRAIRHDPSGPRPVPGQAHRRAVGRGPRRLSGGSSRCCGRESDGIYRDAMRDFWRGQARGRRLRPRAWPARATSTREAANRSRRSTSSPPRRLHAADLVSYNEKHNEANLEENRDGTDDNRRWNCGAEGATDDPEIHALRARQQRNFLTTLLLSQGVPMMLGGDEIGRTQGGNNNAWCQDNEIAWFDWDIGDDASGCSTFTRRLIALRRAHPVFRRAAFLTGERGADRASPTSGGSGPTGGGWRGATGPATGATARRVPQRRGDPRAHAQRRADRRRHVPAPLQRAHEDVDSSCRPALRARWALELSTARARP